MWLPPVAYFMASIALTRYARAAFIPGLLTDRLFEFLPASFLDETAQTMDSFTETFAFINIILLYFGAYWLFSLSWDSLRRYFRNPFFGALALWAAHVLILLPLLGQGILGRNLPEGARAGCLFLLASHWIFARALQFQRRRTVAVST